MRDSDEYFDDIPTVKADPDMVEIAARIIGQKEADFDPTDFKDGYDDAMRAIQLYAEAIADAVIEGKGSIPDVPTGDDEFVELDEQGNPKPRAGRGRGAPKKETPVRARRGGAAAPAARRKPQPSVAAPAEEIGRAHV